MNLANKEQLTRSWDIHAERLLDCTDCHYSTNNPVYYQETDATKPDHLIFDPRRIKFGEYLQTPLHQFARGNSAQNLAASDLNYTMRDCADCHDPGSSHDWLPYQDSHLAAVSCETCHIPQLYSSANMQHDWTVLQIDGTAQKECRGTDQGDLTSMGALLTGYQPVQIAGPDGNGGVELSPHNLITTWFWVYGDPPRPVRLADLEDAYFENGNYHPGILDRFDENQDGTLAKSELKIDTPAKEQFVRDRLTRLGLSNPRITGEIQAYSIHHDVAAADWALKDCTACHNADSQLSQAIMLSSYSPNGVQPEFVSGSDRSFTGQININDSGAVYYQPNTALDELYIFGRDRVRWIDLGGGLLFLGVLLGVMTHGGLRMYTNSKTTTTAAQPTSEKIYMYSAYERFWHWLQTAAILLLLTTGLAIHRPDSFGFLDFRGVVLVHNVVAVILGLNAGLSLFFHLASGEIKQYIPRPRGFFDRSIAQALYYLKGIFNGEDHPFEKTPEKKLNPLQQITYFGLLNLLLPLQGITGILMWGVQRWPGIATWFGGLPVLAPFHTLVAWLFAAFIVLHVYLTTTGHTTLSGIEAMITGWEEIESHQTKG
jgi:thiosulfate reductase cytochrome b subunit